jgi:transposase
VDIRGKEMRMDTMDSPGRKSKPRRVHPEEFKKGAVGLVLDGGKTVIEVARSLGLSESVLFEWVRKAKLERAKGAPGALKEDERAELARLRKENVDLRMERELLKKWAAFFAKENA